MNDPIVKEKVYRYYKETTEDYLKYYGTSRHHHMHFGFDRDLPKGGSPTTNLVRYLAGLAGLLPVAQDKPGAAGAVRPRVLDAGCGVGGSSIWLTREAGADCVGITLVEDQARHARAFAARDAAGRAGDEGPKANFLVNDFTVAAFKPESFDVVWAIESFDYAPDKEAWVKQMFGLLKPGGRLVIADGFRNPGTLNPAQQRAYGHFLSGWAVPHLCTFEELEAWARGAGFETTHAEDVSADVMLHSRRIQRFGWVFIPMRAILRVLRLTSREKLGNAYATLYQYRTLKQGLWSFGVFCFRKPA